MGPIPTEDQKSKYEQSILSFRMGRVKTSYDNVRTIEIKKERKKAKQETGVKFKRLMQ